MVNMLNDDFCQKTIRFWSKFTSLGKIFIKELQIVPLTSNVSNGNGKMEELERKTLCKTLTFP